MPASLNAPCADETDGHAAHDAHEVLVCQAARTRIRVHDLPTVGAAASKPDLVPPAKQPETREAAGRPLIDLRDRAAQAPARVVI
jgi:hypothetical protein